ncbi:LysR family transcriptional regulator [Actinoplanes awajinensis]|uniref:LysR family transcriptional regulator n=1 Tax=Actinoplanes awajinensis subsp. mycoplanecinus TaxID=135947 RepID=A0A0X3V5T9_9ACTN|nr:LysR family transcriptional regulator [Actinoplanes awajinensis]KUL40169.1 LysR family transcriptional regulator [Actinoplanes awajinensis subsp. mycoplanecinus]
MAIDRLMANLDLNLLITLDTLLRERNVTRTADHLGVSQPAVSGALARLRRHFDDPLLTRVGNRYELTALAARVAALTGPAIAGVRRVFETTAEFDPSRLDREFTLVISDYAATVLAPLVAREIGRLAPGVRLRLEQTTPYAVDHAADTLRAADGLIIPHGFVTDLPYLDLFEDRWVCIVSHDHPSVGDTLTLDQLGTLPWVAIFDRPTAFAPAARQLRMLGIEARVDVVVDGFAQMPFLVAGTRRVALIQERLARQLAPVTGVRILDCPFDVVPVAEAFWWNPMYRNDPAHAWLRTLIVAAAAPLRHQSG